MAIVADYKFDDSSADGLASNSVATRAPHAAYRGDAFAKDGSAVFNGKGDYLEIPAGGEFGLEQGSVTISFVQGATAPGDHPWAKPGGHTLFSVDSSGYDKGGHLGIYINSDGTLMVRHQTHQSDHFYKGGMIKPGEPVTVSYSWGPEGSLLVVNGAKTDAGDVALTLSGHIEPITIGASQSISGDGIANNMTGFFEGSISRVQISNSPTKTGGFVPCFAEGTRILTVRGHQAVETLRPGDLVVTLDRGPQPVRWVGRRELGHADLASNARLRPVTIRTGALGNRRPLVLSRQHCVLMPDGGAGAFVRAAHLARFGDGRFRVAQGVRRVVYRHLLFDRHEIIFAEGALVESLLPGQEARAACPDLAAHLDGLSPEARVQLSKPARPVAAGGIARLLVSGGGFPVFSHLPLAPPQIAEAAGSHRQTLRA